MRNIINISAIVFFVWLVLDELNVPTVFLNFLLAGELPGGDKSLSPTTMLAIITATACLITFHVLIRQFDLIRHTRHYLRQLNNKQERLPKRRFGRI